MTPANRKPHNTATVAVDTESTASERNCQRVRTPWAICNHQARSRNAAPTTATGIVATCNAGATASPTPELPTRPSKPGTTHHQGSGNRPLNGRSNRSNSQKRISAYYRSAVNTVFAALTRAFVRLHVAVYRLTRGRIGGRWGRAPILLLTTTGRRSGEPRTTPLLFIEDGGAYVVVATNDGAPQHPQWYLNLRADPLAEAQVLSKRVPVRAEDASDGERERLWPRLVDVYPNYDRDQRRTQRRLPVVLLRTR